MRRLIPLTLCFVLAACPSYDRYGYVTTDKGMLPPDTYAKYGTDQAISVAVGREFAKGYAGGNAAGFAKQADAALGYARKFPQLKTVTADTLGHRLVLTFVDGWSTQVIPITDGKSGDETVNWPKAK
jgi:hypothetical protein